jgi:hypothetical protein
MKSSIFSATLFATALVTSGLALGEDALVPGKKLVIRNNPTAGTSANLVVFLAKSVALEHPNGNDQVPTGPAGGSLRVSGAGGDFVIDLPTIGWTVKSSAGINSPKTLIYRDPTGATCKRIMFRGGALAKAVCKGPQVAFDLGAAQGPISVVLSFGSEPLRNCHRFGSAAPESCDVKKDGSDDRVFLAKNCVGPPVGCPSPSGAFLDELNEAF